MGPAIEEWISDDDQSIDPRVHEGSKGHVDLRFGAGVRELETQPEDARSLLRLSRARYGIRILRVHETAYQRCLGQHLVQCFELLCRHAAEYGAYACCVATRTIDACDEAKVTGSPAIAKTMGMVVLAALAASAAAGPPTATMTAGWLRASSVASAGNRSYCSSAQEKWLITLRPST